jgi:hypothetical protein
VGDAAGKVCLAARHDVIIGLVRHASGEDGGGWEIYLVRDGARYPYAFGLVELNGKDMRAAPIEARKAALAKLVPAKMLGLAFTEHLTDDGPIIFRHACKLGCEGIVSKRLGSPIVPAAHLIASRPRTRTARPLGAWKRRTGGEARPQVRSTQLTSRRKKESQDHGQARR